MNTPPSDIRNAAIAKKRIYICQQSHIYDGWKICMIPCHCGPAFYPSKAREANPLHPSEYYTEYPDYNNVQSVASSSGSGAAEASRVAIVSFTCNRSLIDPIFNRKAAGLTKAKSNWSPTPISECYQEAYEEAYENQYEAAPDTVAHDPHVSKPRHKGKTKLGTCKPSEFHKRGGDQKNRLTQYIFLRASIEEKRQQHQSTLCNRPQENLEWKGYFQESRSSPSTRKALATRVVVLERLKVQSRYLHV